MLSETTGTVTEGQASLENLGFRLAAQWSPPDASGALRYGVIAGQEALLNAENALYAFCMDRQVCYIGKTTQTIRKRFVGYCRPGATQATNLRCHGRIREALASERRVEILVFADTLQLHWGALPINLAAGLEDALIEQFDPPWNATAGKKRKTETAEHEDADAGTGGSGGADPSRVLPSMQPLTHFLIHLGPTYYRQGFFNPGAAASQMLGAHDDPISVFLGDTGTVVTSRIDRRANSNGSVRVIGGNAAIARWFQATFDQGQTVHADVVGPHAILLRPPESSP